MKDNNKPKGYIIKKRIDRPAKVVGLYYNTFFVFILSAALIFMIGSAFSWIGIGVAILVIAAIYFFLFYIQTKLGPKEVKKLINNYNNPINYIKIDKSIRRIKK